MRIHATQPLFAWSELEDSPSLQTIRGVRASLPDQPLLDALRQARGHGRNDYPLEVLLGCGRPGCPVPPRLAQRLPGRVAQKPCPVPHPRHPPGRRRRADFFQVEWTRNVMVLNLFPWFAPLVVPFAYVPIEGDWYGFDTGAGPVGGEFPVVYVAHGSTMWEPMTLAPTFPDFCRGTDSPDTKSFWDWWVQHQRERSKRQEVREL